MNHIRRILAALATLAGALLAVTATAPAAFAHPVPPGGGGMDGTVPPPTVRTVVVGGMPGWQITLIAAAAALAAAMIAVMLDRALTARRRVTRAAT
jgi:hypothetical protein